MTVEGEVKGIRILPGQWRPHYDYEQIAWVSPPWDSQDYIWLDYPEAIFTDQGLLFLSHTNPNFPVVFPDPPKTPWRAVDDGIAFDRVLPNGVAFGGSLRASSESAVGLELHINNGSPETLTSIKLQTCAYLRAIKEFADPTMDNKLVHVPDKGWMSYETAKTQPEGSGRVALGWREGPAVCDLPWIVTLSKEPGHLVAMTWKKDTLSLVGNPQHPCMHADPVFPDLPPGQSAEVRGEMVFSEGGLETFEEAFEDR